MAEPSKVIHVRNVGHEISEVGRLHLPCPDSGYFDILCGMLGVYFFTNVYVLRCYSVSALPPEAEVVGNYKCTG